jgi:hypothetical protein
VRLSLIPLLLLCSGCGTFFSSHPTTLEPRPVKASLQDAAVDIGVPLVTEKKKTGGYRSPVELHFDVLLTKISTMTTPIKPSGGTVGIRIRW